MPNSILPQDKDGQELYNSISSFFQTFGLGNLLRKCNAQKEKGVSVLDIFKYKLCNVFSDWSMYMQQKTGSFREAFSKNTFYRFLNNPKINWLRFTTLLSKKAAESIEPLTDEKRVNVFVVDDTLFERTSCKKTELCSRVFDRLLASSNAESLVGPVYDHDGRSLAAKRRCLAQMKGTDVMIELLKNAQSAGHHAEYVLFDTWFSCPAQLIAVKDLGLDSIAMIKKSSRIYYEYNGERLSLSKIFGICKKRRGRSKYLLSVHVMIGKDRKIPAKIVCVRNKKNKKDWVAFICTNPDLSEEEIIRNYGKRWQIEVFFKTCKTYLRLIKECHSQSFDALTAHIAIVFTRYLMLALEQRKREDDRTLGELFFFFTDELADITFGESFQIIMTALIESVCAIFKPTEEQLSLFIEMFVGKLPDYIRNSLAKTALAA